MTLSYTTSNLVSGLFLATALSLHGLKKKKLSPSGAAAAFTVGFLSFASSKKSGIILIMFYYLGSKATKVGAKKKELLDISTTQSSVRGAEQVFCCSLLATICAVLSTFVFPTHSVELWHAQVAHYSCCLADTLASELGMLSKSAHLIIPPFRAVPKGTNGGVSLYGFVVSVVGGGMIGTVAGFSEKYESGASFSLSSEATSRYVLTSTIFGAIVGLFGSVVDSVLGATCQTTYFDVAKKQIVRGNRSNAQNIKHISGLDILSNATVNLVSVALTMVCGIVIGSRLFPPL